MGVSTRAWSVFESTTCHYCGDHAGTVDHIVPRSLLPKPQSRLPYWFRAHNIVPACFKDNGKKANFRSDCECETCVWAWQVAKALFLTGPEPAVIRIVRSPG